jgi:hypothetical protein
MKAVAFRRPTERSNTWSPTIRFGRKFSCSGPKDLLTEQAKLPDSPFEVTDTSGREHFIDECEARVRHRIDNTDVVVVLCGEHAFLAKGSAEEFMICTGEKHVILPFDSRYR